MSRDPYGSHRPAAVVTARQTVPPGGLVTVAGALGILVLVVLLRAATT